MNFEQELEELSKEEDLWSAARSRFSKKKKRSFVGELAKRQRRKKSRNELFDAFGGSHKHPTTTY
jgi:hypothetical protein